MILLLLVAAAWGSLFVPLPRWASVLGTVAVLCVGALLLIAGLLATDFGGAASSGADRWIAGALMLLSRIGIVIRIVLEALAAPNAP